MWKAALHCADGWRGGSSGLQTAGPQRINRIKQRFPRGSNQYEGRSFCGFLQTFRRHIMTKQSQHICRTLDHIRSEEHTSELQSLMRNSSAVLCSKKKKQTHII